MMTLHLLIRTVRPSPLPSGEQVEIQLKYAGYLARQKRQVEEFKREETRLLPPIWITTPKRSAAGGPAKLSKFARSPSARRGEFPASVRRTLPSY